MARDNVTLSDLYDIDWLLNKEKNFVLYFRPRCGSTTLTRWFFENMGVKFTGVSISQFRNDWLKDKLDDLKDYLDRNYEALHKFVVVRNPMERAVSSYLHVVNNVTDAQWDVVKPYVEEKLGKHDLTFRQWVEYLSKIDLDKAHIIWRRQSALSCWDRGVDDIIALENMNSYLLEMNERFNLDAKPGFNSVTVAEKEKTHPRFFGLINKFYGDTPFSEFLKLKEKNVFHNFPDYSHFYDSTTRKKVKTLYQKDIEIYNAAGGCKLDKLNGFS